jgi:DNA adenine methylase
MNPFFCRLGNKSSIALKLIKIFPKHKIYVEPFVGSGAILFAKEPSEIEIINDLDDQVIKNFKLLKHAQTDLNKYNLRTNLQDMNKLTNRNPRKVTDKLLKSLYLSCNTFSSSGNGKIYGTWAGISKVKNISFYKERLAKVKMYNEDYKKVINAYDSYDTFFYIDPPYENSDGLYKEHLMDYEELRNILTNIKGYFMISLNDSKYLRNVFKGFVIKSITVNEKSQSNNLGKKRKELIIMNYKLKASE